MSWSTSELRVRLARRETGLSPLVKHFTGRSKVILLFWISYVFVLSCVCYVFVHVCLCALWSPAGKGLTSWLCLWCLTVSLSYSHWYPGSGVVLDCIDSWSLHPYLLWFILTSSWWLVTVRVLWLFLMVSFVSLQYVIVVFPDHTHLFCMCFIKRTPSSKGYTQIYNFLTISMLVSLNIKSRLHSQYIATLSEKPFPLFIIINYCVPLIAIIQKIIVPFYNHHLFLKKKITISSA